MDGYIQNRLAEIAELMKQEGVDLEAMSKEIDRALDINPEMDVDKGIEEDWVSEQDSPRDLFAELVKGMESLSHNRP